MIQVKVFQTTIVTGTQDRGEYVLVSCRSLDGVHQLSMQVKPDSTPMVGDLFDVQVAPVITLGDRLN